MPADADYMREYRRLNPEKEEIARRTRRAYQRALTALRERHRAEFTDIVNAERITLGVPPIGVRRPGPRRKDDAA